MQPGSSPGYLNQPDDAYVLKNGDITVADAMNDRILFLSPAGARSEPDRHQRRGGAQPAHERGLSERRHAAGQRGRAGLGDQRLVDHRVHPGGQAGLDAAPPDRQLPLRPPAARPEPLPAGRLRPAGGRADPHDPALRRHRLDLRRAVRGRRAEEAVAGRAAPERADHGERRLPQPRRRHRPALRHHRVAVRDHRRGRARRLGCSASRTASTSWPRTARSPTHPQTG